MLEAVKKSAMPGMVVPVRYTSQRYTMPYQLFVLEARHEHRTISLHLVVEHKNLRYSACGEILPTV